MVALQLALDVLLTRRSVGVKYLAEPGPDDAQLQVMMQAALRAPDHAGLVPFRFALVRGAARERLAELFTHAARRAGKADAEVARDGERALRAPVTLAVIARLDPAHPQVPVHEQWACVGGAVTNVLNAAHALGLGAKMLSGNKARDPHVAAAFCRPAEVLVGWIALGTPVQAPGPAGPKRRAADVLETWPG